MKILSVKINNILSIEDALVEFDDNGLILVEGWNNDTGRANGAGKTAIFNALTFALFDKLPRKITASEILRRGSKSGYVEVALQNGGKNFSIKRTRPKGVTFSEDGATRTITQEEFENLIGLNYNQFILSMYCAQSSSSRFLSLNDADKKQFILQLLNLEEFSACKSVADKKVKDLEQDLLLLKGKEETIAAKTGAYEESLIDEDLCRSSIQVANDAIASMSKDLLEAQVVSAPDMSRFQVLEDNIYSKRAELTKVKTRREMLHEQYRKLNSKIVPFNGSSECYACGTTLDTSQAEKHHDDEVLKYKQELAGLKQQIDTCDLALQKETQVQELTVKLNAKKKEETKEYEKVSLRAQDLQSKIALKQREIKELTLKLENNFELMNKINILSQNLKLIVNKKSAILSDIELYKTMSSVYSPTGAQAYILDSVIDSFNEQVSSYVGILWTNLHYSLQSYKENVKGEVTAKFSENLSMDGKPASIGSLSGGEYRALSLCVDFALVSVMERQFGISMSPIILDEPFDGLDAVGRETVIDLLGTISESRQVVIIDHTSEVKSMFSKVLTVEKTNGISTVKLST